LNILTITSPAAVLNGGTEINAEHACNIQEKFTTLAVLNRGTVTKEEQSANMAYIPVLLDVLPATAPVLNSGTLLRLRHPLNILAIFVTRGVSNRGTSSRE